MVSLDHKKGKGRRGSSKKLTPLNQEPVKKYTKKDLVEACRKNAPAFDSTAMLLRRKMRLKNVNPGVRAEDPDIGSQVTVMDNGVKTNAKKYNEYKLVADRLEVEFKKKTDELGDLKKDESALDEMINCTNPESKRIQELLVEIEKVNRATEKKLHYRLQLNHMLARLQKNSVTLDAHINAMEDTHHASEKELLTCENLMRDVEAGRTKSLRDLEATELSVKTERNDRARIIGSKKNEAMNASKMEAWRLSTEKVRQELAQSLKGDLNQEEEQKLVRDLYMKEDQWKHSKEMNDALLAKVSVLEKGFMEIKDVTGVNSLEEMVNKFANHKEHRDRLALEKKEAEERLQSAKKALEDAKTKFESVKEEGFGDTELNREITNEIRSQILAEKTEGKVVRATNERLEKVLVGLRQGGMGLYQRLIAYHENMDLGEAPQLNESARTSAIEAALDTIKMLNVTESVLGRMLETIGGFEQGGNAEGQKFSSLPDEEDGTVSSSIGGTATLTASNVEDDDETLENPNLGTANVRIDLKKRAEEQSSEDDSGKERSDNFDDLSIDDSEAVENMVPSRSFLKMSSGRQAGEAMRALEMETRRRKYHERLLAADASEFAQLTSTTANKKKQSEANDRLAKHHHPVGLPKSLTVRDDPMTKASVFITEMPKLE